jgi:hypothetical protein
MSKFISTSSLLGVLLFFFSIYLVKTGSPLCVEISGNITGTTWISWCHVVFALTTISIPIFIVSTILNIYGNHSHSSVNKNVSFLKYYIFIYLALLIISPWNSGDEYFSVTKGVVAIALSILYLIISLGIMISGYFKAKSK